MCVVLRLPIMLRFKKLGGGFISGETAADIIRALREQSRDPRGSIAEFMEATADACQLQSGAIISTHSANEFVVDLTENGFLTAATG